MKIGSLFSGIGGLELGVSMANPGAEVSWQAECDPYALAVLGHHWPTVRRYTDVRDIDETAARVDVVCGGFPCQPHSLAGKRRGTSDERWIWPEFARIVGALRPSYVFVENVPGLRTSGLRDVLADLASLGFDAEWDLFSAEETGAPHRRNRLFVLAYANREHSGVQPGRRSRESGPGSAELTNDGTHWALANSDSNARESRRARYAGEGASGWDSNRGNIGENMADAEGIGTGEQADAANAVAGSRPAWSQPGGGGWWAAEPDVGRVADGVSARAHRLRLLGNSVVPQQAALAWSTLIARSARR